VRCPARRDLTRNAKFHLKNILAEAQNQSYLVAHQSHGRQPIAPLAQLIASSVRPNPGASDGLDSGAW
jgi:hypothetical protein